MNAVAMRVVGTYAWFSWAHLLNTESSLRWGDGGPRRTISSRSFPQSPPSAPPVLSGPISGISIDEEWYLYLGDELSKQREVLTI